MSKAEEKAQAAYPAWRNGLWDEFNSSSAYCGFIKGYHQAEKDVAEEMIDKIVEWLKNNVTYTHPRKGTKECLINIAKLKDDLRNQ